MMPAGVAAAQARIDAIESRFAQLDPSRRMGAGTGTVGAAEFDRMLASARVEHTSSAGHVHDHIHTSEMGAAGPPPELAAYGNGRIPAAALTPIGQGNHRMWAPAAESFNRMAEAAARDGVAIRVTDSYRSYDAQVDLANRKGIYGKGGLAAVPGTSNHGWGRSLDIDTAGGTAEWLRANGARFGFHEDVPGEPWHWTYRPG